MRICLDLRTGRGCMTENRSGAVHCCSCGQSLRHALELHDPGIVVAHYCIKRVIGFGGFGAVYQAEDMQHPGQTVALKESFDPNSIRSFQGEFAVLQRLEHDNLPHYYAMFEANGSGYLAMEFVPGQSLDDVLTQRTGRPLTETQVLGYAVQLCDVLRYLHRQHPPIIHRDIKPANIRLTPDGLIKLVDFGLLKQGTGTTHSSRLGLTPAYAPLEQWGSTGQHTDARSDLYSLAATLYHLLAGQPPLAVSDRLSRTPDPLLPPHQHNPRISPHVSEAIMRAMAMHPPHRPPAATAFKQALMGVEREPGVHPRTQTPQPGAPPHPSTIRVTQPPDWSPQHLVAAPQPAPSPVARHITAHVGWGLWWWWVLTNVAGGGAGFLLGLLASAVVWNSTRSDPVASAVLGIGYGTAVGLAQWRILRRYIPLQAINWILATLLSAGVSFGLSNLLGLLQSGYFYDASPLFLLVTFIGTSIGLAQWLILRRHVPRAGWWIPANTVGLLTGTSCWMIYGPYSAFLFQYLAGIVCPSLVTGAVLVWLLRGMRRGP